MKMNLKLLTLSAAVTTALMSTPASALHYNPEIVNMKFDGLFTMLDPAGRALQNFSNPYYNDPTWGYGQRTQISGTINFNKSTGKGSATINPFNFLARGELITNTFELQAIGNGLVLGDMDIVLFGNTVTSQIVLDATGLFSDWASNGYPGVGTIYDSTYCAASSACATPASNDIRQSRYPIGPVPIATSSFNVTGNSGLGTTLADLSLGTDDFIGGSPMDNGPFSGYNINLDFTSLTVSTVPIPAAVWLFGTGLISLISLARKRKTLSNE